MLVVVTLLLPMTCAEAEELFFLGYQANRHLSFELGYVDFGKVRETYAFNPDIRFISKCLILP